MLILSIQIYVKFCLIFSNLIPLRQNHEKGIKYCKVVNINTPQLQARFRFYRLFMKEKFDVCLREILS